MTKEQYQALMRAPLKCIRASDLKDRSPRTLLWGYTCDKDSWHVYLDFDGHIKVLCYSYTGLIQAFLSDHDIMLDNQNYIPNKRLYPEACDEEFCRMLLEANVELPFTVFNETRPPRQFHGKVWMDGKLTECDARVTKSP